MHWLSPLLLLLILPPPSSNIFLISGYDFSNANDENPLRSIHPSSLEPSEIGETFTVTRAFRVTTVTFSLFREGDPTVTLLAVLYHSANGIPTGDPIAKSLPVTALTVLACDALGHGCSIKSDRQVYAINFTFSSTPLLLPGAAYGVAVRVEGPGTIGDSSAIWVSKSGRDGFRGDTFYFHEGKYHVIVNDIVFQVFGRLPSRGFPTSS